MLIVKSFLHIALTVLLIMLVLMIFISPVVDLPKTALRSQQSLLILLLGIISLVSRGLVRGNSQTPNFSVEGEAEPVLQFGPSACICVLLC